MSRMMPHTEYSADHPKIVGHDSADISDARDFRSTVRCINSAASAGDMRQWAESAPWLYTLASVGQNHVPLSRLIYVQITKPLLDVLLTLIALIVVIPVALVIASLIRITTNGPVLFRQTRIGLGGRPFTVYKFRTMIDDRRQSLQDVPFPDRRYRHKTDHDPRVTRIGAFLRRTSLDELPQLVNVLRGEMSLVGPRPELPGLVQQYEDWQHVRHLVRPGVTGWWQVNGRSDLPMHENTELDSEYVQRVSLWMDLRIILRTIRVVCGGSGAF